MSQKLQPPKKIPETDVQKLHAEVLQLRNQQFIIGTLALTGAGFALVFLSTLQENNNPIPGVTLLGILVAWFFILGFLFRWSLSLRKLITIISEYVKIATVEATGDEKPASHWEKWYYELSHDEKIKNELNIESQTELVRQAFIFYGAIAAIISIANCYQYGVDINGKLSFPGTLSFMVILFFIFLFFRRVINFLKHNFEKENENLEKNIFSENKPQKDSKAEEYVIKSGILKKIIKIDPTLKSMEIWVFNQNK